MPRHSFGAQMYFGPADPPTQVGGIISISMSGFDTTQTHVTALDQAVRWKEFLNGLVDGGDVTFKINFLKTQLTTLMGYVGHADPYYQKIYAPDGSTLTGRANLQKFVPLDIPEDDRITADVTLKLTGIQVFTAAA